MSEPAAPSASGGVSFDNRILIRAILIGTPGSVFTLLFVWLSQYSLKVQLTCTLLVIIIWIPGAFLLRNQIIASYRLLGNLLAAIREGDYSFRARRIRNGGVLDQVMLEVNSLSDILKHQRLDALEATVLLRKVMQEIGAAVYAFDEDQTLKLVNRAGEMLLDTSSERLLGETAEVLGLSECLRGPPIRMLDRDFAGQKGRWGLRRTRFREAGIPHDLLVISDISKPLRDEERQAWKRLVRVMGHELNNSLAPIKSLAGTLNQLTENPDRPDDWESDLKHGLEIISSRAEALNRFMTAYSKLARLPHPSLGKVDVGNWVKKVAALETRKEISVKPGPDVIIQADIDQLEQLLINLIRNAVDATENTGGNVSVHWTCSRFQLELTVLDEGCGIANPANLFVPFFTTKPSGTGIGLVLSRQIAEEHGGLLTLDNRTDDVTGCAARLTLPISPI